MRKIHKAITVALEDGIHLSCLSERFGFSQTTLKKHFKLHGVFNISKFRHHPTWEITGKKLNCSYHLTGGK